MTYLNSSDLLNIVLAFVVLWLGVFLGWALWYIIMILRDMRLLTGATREKVEWAGELVREAREKMNSSMTYLALLSKGVAEVMGYVRERRETKPPPYKRRVKVVKEEREENNE